AALPVNSFGPGRAGSAGVRSGGDAGAAAMGGSVVDGSESAGSSVGPGGDEGGGGGSGATDPGAAAAMDPGGAVATDPPGAAATDGLTRASTILTSGSAPRTRPSMRSPSTSKSAAKRREPRSWRLTTMLHDTSDCPGRSGRPGLRP